MDCMQQTTHNIYGSHGDQCQLKLVNYEAHENHVSHETQGLSKTHLVVRRGKPFKITLVFDGRWDPRIESLSLEVWLGNMSERIRVQSSDEWSDPLMWSAKIYPGDMHSTSVTIHICSPVLSSVAFYELQLHLETRQCRRSYVLGTFVLLCNPWLKDDPVYMPLDVQTEEYIKSDYGLIYMGTPQNICRRPWLFSQYEPGVLEACLKLLQVSPQHLRDKNQDYALRADPAYLCRVLCAMVNCNDDLGILQGKWQGSYKNGVKPTEWSSSADILHQWVASSCSPVRYGQCWVFAAVLCTVMRVLGIPSRVVTVFNSAHDTDGSVKIEEYYSSTGEKLNISKDSIWNFHVWVECWMRRPDLGSGFDGWQVVDPTPQEKSAGWSLYNHSINKSDQELYKDNKPSSAGVFCCGPCPVVAIQQRCLSTPFDAAFIYAAVDADIIRLVVRKGLVVGRMVDTDAVGQLVYTKSIGSDRPENLTAAYKGKKSTIMSTVCKTFCTFTQFGGFSLFSNFFPKDQPAETVRGTARTGQYPSQSLEVSLEIDGVPTVGDCIIVCVTISNHSNSSRVLIEHLNAQLKEFDSNPQDSFWKSRRKVHIRAGEVLKLNHIISPSEYEAYLAGDDIVNVAVVIKDMRTNKRVLAAQEFSINSPQIKVEIEGGNTIKLTEEHTAQVSFINTFSQTLSGAVLTVEGSGLLEGKHEARLCFLQHGEKIEKQVSIVASSPGTKVLMVTLSHRNCPGIVSRSFHTVFVMSA
ncbi:protein-glutamine gamma-glutamyltransferase 2-like [Xyrichtys novacula]|uniref:Protein-glutamine gamma-glutamyltransferase 2-like n=1 Tax=Xyrichtys novacula TaxID=13765 RepID=A0AAV1F3H0_XYRNO|nr:protein-glutamine gamma-glutamyltransferase 2-like [Xyrichtys novacula]